MSIRMIAMDIDGTLLSTQKTLTPRTRQVLLKAAGRGILLVPCTGRACEALPSELKQLPFPYRIHNSGAIVLEQHTGKRIYYVSIPQKLLLQCLSIIQRHDLVCNFVTDAGSYMHERHLKTFCSYTRLDEAWVKSFIGRQTSFTEFDQWTTPEALPVLKLNLFFRDGAERNDTRRELEQICGIDICSSITGNLEITSQDATKGKALMALANYLRISREDIMTFGDSDNDISMLTAAGVGVAMANSAPETLAAADRVTLSNDDDGVAWGIEQWVLNNEC